MSVTVSVRSYTHSVTYVTDNILKSFKDIIRLSGLDPDRFVQQWDTLHNGIRTWIDSQHLERVVLEVFDPRSDALLGRWDVEIAYGWSTDNGQFWVDTDAIKFAMKKAGVHPATASYSVKVTRKTGFAAVAGWSSTTLRSTSGLIEQRVGSTVEGSGLTGGFSYYRRV
jgi:hypothetical protein